MPAILSRRKYLNLWSHEWNNLPTSDCKLVNAACNQSNANLQRWASYQVWNWCLKRVEKVQKIDRWMDRRTLIYHDFNNVRWWRISGNKRPMLSLLSILNDDLALVTEFKARTHGIDIWMVKIKKVLVKTITMKDTTTSEVTRSLARSLLHSLLRSLTHSLAHSLPPSHPPSLTHPPTRHVQPWIGRNSAVMKSLKKQQLMLKKATCLLTHSLTHSPTHPPTHSLAHTLIHTLTRPYLVRYLSRNYMEWNVDQGFSRYYGYT